MPSSVFDHQATKRCYVFPEFHLLNIRTRDYVHALYEYRTTIKNYARKTSLDIREWTGWGEWEMYDDFKTYLKHLLELNIFHSIQYET